MTGWLKEHVQAMSMALVFLLVVVSSFFTGMQYGSTQGFNMAIKDSREDKELDRRLQATEVLRAFYEVILAHEDHLKTRSAATNYVGHP